MVVSLSGGLGNQMFQYAFGLFLKHEKKYNVYYDLNWLNHIDWQKGTTIRYFELDIFNVYVPNANEKLPFSVFNYGLVISKYIYWLLIRFFSLEERTEFRIDYDLINKLSENSIVKGYFQTEDYFKKYEILIRKSFVFKKEITANSAQYLSLIRGENAVSLHVRRGDYVSSANFANYHGTCSAEYYIKAINFIKENVNNPLFFIFSDDLEWVKLQVWINGLNCIFVAGNEGIFSYEDMRLMSNCKHNIIANSSFSWWGAWLNANVEKIVVAPLRWFNCDKNDEKQDRLVPETWIRF